MTTLRAWDKRLDRFDWNFEFGDPEERHRGQVGLAELEATAKTSRAFYLLFAAYRSVRYYHTQYEDHLAEVRSQLHIPRKQDVHT